MIKCPKVKIPLYFQGLYISQIEPNHNFDPRDKCLIRKSICSYLDPDGILSFKEDFLLSPKKSILCDPIALINTFITPANV